MISTSTGERQYVVYQQSEYDALLNSILLRDLVLIEVPKDSREYVMANGQTILMHTNKKDDMLMQDCEGKIIKTSEKSKDAIVGDKVIFHYLLLNAGRDEPNGSQFTFKYNDTLYLVVSDKSLFFAIRNGEYISLNGWYLIDGVKNEANEIELNVGKTLGSVSHSGIIDLAKQDYKSDRCQIVCAPKGSQYEVGDVVMTHGTWDVPIKSDTMRKKEKRYFRCQDWNLVCDENFVC